MTNSHENEPFVGPQADERGERQPDLHDIRLEKDVPLWYLFLNDPDAPVVSAGETNDAKSKLGHLISLNPDKIRECAGKSMEEARNIINNIEE
jgi:hypothetical protein